MSTTAQQVFVTAMAIADEMTDTINVVNASDTASYLARTPGILTVLQAELVKQGDLYSTFEYSHKPLAPLGGIGSGFDYVSYDGTEIIVENIGSAYAYSIDIDGEATVYVEDSSDGSTWNTLATISATDPTSRSYTTYKATLAPSVGATRTRFRFAGTYEYTFTNYALFSQRIKTARLPEYAPWVKVSLPSDLKSVDQIINEYAPQQYNKDGFYKWENMRDMYVSYDYEGTIRVNYRPIPALVSAMTDAMQLDDVTCRTLLPYGLCADLFKEENSQIATFCLTKYKELKAVATKAKPANEQVMVDVYGGF
jgi:hypothetical protein